MLPTDGDYYVRLYQFTHLSGGPDHFYRLSMTTAPWIDAVIPPMVPAGQATQVTVYGRNLPGGKLDPAAGSTIPCSKKPSSPSTRRDSPRTCIA